MHFHPFIFLVFLFSSYSNFFCFVFLLYYLRVLLIVLKVSTSGRTLRVLVSLFVAVGDCHGTYLLAYLLVRHRLFSCSSFRFLVVPSWCLRCCVWLRHPWRSYGVFGSFQSSSRRFGSFVSFCSMLLRSFRFLLSVSFELCVWFWFVFLFFFFLSS